MKNKKYHNIKNKISAVIVILIIVFFVGFFVYTNWKINKRRAELNTQIIELTEEVRLAEERNKALKEKKEKTESEAYVEEVAREQLGLNKPGEETFVIQKEPAPVESDSGVTKKQSWWEKLLRGWMK
ncbi:cell division protein FtsL [Patescibacteria group bacterium]|nr:cell division protein FtsL [Patescibacteria group bacterium]